jgi:hypothetical protein
MTKTAKKTNAHNSKYQAPRRLAVITQIPRKRKPRCTAVTSGGQPCKANPVHGKRFCLFHTPGRAAECGQVGGRRRAVYNPDNLERFESPKSAGELLRLLATTIVEVRSGRMDPRVANTVAYLGASFLSAMEKVELESRLQALEQKLPKTTARVQ